MTPFHSIASAGAEPNPRQVAGSLRPLFEVFVRAAYPDHVSAGQVLGHFQNIAHQALIAGHTVLFATAGQLLRFGRHGELRRRLRHYVAPDFLVIDEIGSLSYFNRHGDLLFELVSRRYEIKSTLITTNKPFAEWPQMFPNAGCVP